MKFIPRGSRRYSSVFPVELRPTDGAFQDEGLEVLTIDLSASGVGVLSSRPFLPGRSVSVTISEPMGRGRWRLSQWRGEVVNLHVDSDGFRVGIAFDDPKAGPAVALRVTDGGGDSSSFRFDPAWAIEAPELGTKNDRAPESSDGRGPEPVCGSHSAVTRLFHLVAWSGLVLDQLSKASLIRFNQMPGMLRGLFPPLLARPLRNTGALGGWLIGAGLGNVVCVAASLFFTSMIGRLAWRTRNQWRALDALAWGLFLAGVVGNLIDRLTLGYVRDFVKVPFLDNWYCNIADAMAVAGVLLLLASWALYRGPEHPRTPGTKFTSLGP